MLAVNQQGLILLTGSSSKRVSSIDEAIRISYLIKALYTNLLSARRGRNSNGIIIINKIENVPSVYY